MPYRISLRKHEWLLDELKSLAEDLPEGGVKVMTFPNTVMRVAMLNKLYAVRRVWCDQVRSRVAADLRLAIRMIGDEAIPKFDALADEMDKFRFSPINSTDIAVYKRDNMLSYKNVQV